VFSKRQPIESLQTESNFIMRANILIRCLFGFSFLVCSLVSQAQQLLNGVAVHQELGQDVFIGAVYSDSLSNNSSALIQGKHAMRMELKIVSPDGLSTRRFSRLWIEGMAVNNSNNALTQQADNMVKFDSLFKGRFTTNDHIIFSNIPGKGVDIIVNNAVVGNIKDNAFFSMLLSTWIGPVPLSSDFRDGLLKMGNVDDGLRGRFISIAPSAARIAEVAAWTSGQPAAVATAPTTKSAAKASVAAAATTVATAEPPKVAKVDVPLPPVPSVAPPVVSTPTPATSGSGQPSSVAATPAAVTVAAATKPVAAKPATAKASLVDEEDEDDTCTDCTKSFGSPILCI
jgi:periplasmic protein TonB